MKTTWDRVEDKWGINLEAYYLRGGGRRLGHVARSAGPPISRKVTWSAVYCPDDWNTNWLGDFDTKEAAVQAVEDKVAAAHGETAESS